jgi:putative acetyltransferase
MTIDIRYYKDEDAPVLLDIHYNAVHKTGAKDYSQVVLNNWSPPVDSERVAHFQANLDNALRLVAEFNGRIAGFAALVIRNNELRACYIDPDYSGLGVGRALVDALEYEARNAGLTHLEFDSSLTAEPFYNRLGYQTLRHGQHEMRNGLTMSCAHIYKKLV